MEEQSFQPGRGTPCAPAAVAAALVNIVDAAAILGVGWALIGGQALIAHGAPRDTDDVDVLVSGHAARTLAVVLCALSAWVPLRYRPWEKDFVPAEVPTLHRFDDLVLWDLPCEREMYSLRSAQGSLVQLLAAQHPIEREMVATAAPRPHLGVTVPLAPLGGVLLVKALAGRNKDVAAIEQVAEQLPPAALDEALAWVRPRAPGLARTLEEARARRAR